MWLMVCPFAAVDNSDRPSLNLNSWESSTLQIAVKRGSIMQNQTPSPITYLERLPQVQREFRLFGDHVEIDAHWTLGRSFRTTVKLADLSPRATRFNVRNKWFKKSVLIGSIAIGMALLFSREAFFFRVRWIALLCWPVAGVALVLAIRSFQKRQFAHFSRKDGKPGLDICRTDPERFETFMREIQARIRKA